ncbi:unnamed protein product [Lepeophtheirus salmonis]|uniref:(salmon louse) hypothetical protein n=1 Tax=Lepeophtheirus salmonis TaxID=72036 RepID=A0A7R8H974_LEPSM|nr:unnamed protein product [Lepeophtheirus salmonis]CAF2950357.1 unnamed protein product [Lepeophtheirus salmonis]
MGKPEFLGILLEFLSDFEDLRDCLGLQDLQVAGQGVLRLSAGWGNHPPSWVCGGGLQKFIKLLRMDFYPLSLILPQLNMKFAIVLALIAFASASPATYDFTEEKTVKCNVCKYVMSEVEEYITADSTEETVCDKLSSVSDLLVKGCKVIVTQVIKPELEDIITNRPTPQAACENLRLC